MSVELVRDLQEDTYDEAIQVKGIVFVDFWADWCFPCKAMAIIIDELAKKYVDHVTFYKVNTDDAPGIFKTCGISALPTMLIYKDGEIVEKLIGTRSVKNIAAIFDKLLST